jgi:L-ascorbate metabolism protein UlaG (beta-lactamase superfamily)
MTKLSTVLIVVSACLIAAVSAGALADGASSNGVQVMYVGNAGFLITVSDKKVLIDALFDGFADRYTLPQDVLDLLRSAQPPFDGIDLILATHDHDDHFSAGIVREHMTNDPDTIFVSGWQVTGQLSTLALVGRVITLTATPGQPSVEIDAVEGIKVMAIYLSHGEYPARWMEVVNFGFVVTVGEFSFFHMGDMNAAQLDAEGLLPYGLAGENLDLAFIDHWYLAGPDYRPSIAEQIGAAYVLPMHYENTAPVDRQGIQSHYASAVLFTDELDTWSMPAE